MNSLSKTTDDNMRVKEAGAVLANQTGNNLEVFVENILKQHEYTEFWNHKKQLYENIRSVGGKQYAKQVPIGTTIYGSNRKCDFMVFNNEVFEKGLVIECKWQQSAGSVDEKYPYLLYNIIKSGIPTIILLDGDGYKKQAMEWLKEQVDPRRALIGVYNMQEFQKEVNNGLLG